ncbi:glycoside hydrolase family 66 protein [Halobacillus trueperi]|uniref:glycoside hydrolase family 66 protein n=1 Tax=Halobacillus trueperi TaxID=156205 RepID=UPI0037350465
MRTKILMTLFFLVIVLLFFFQSFDSRDESTKIEHLSKDQAKYQPGNEVHFNAQLNHDFSTTFIVNYYYQGAKIDQMKVTPEESVMEWKWKPPETDHQGYLVEVLSSSKDKERETIAVDVSSSWTAFPRYGFLSHFSGIEYDQQQEVMDTLARFHINAIQFYDWHDEHHQPLKFENEKPLDRWANIASETVEFKTVEEYIDLAHHHGMKAMAYNLLYGTLSGAEHDGVRPEWYVYKDKSTTAVDRHALPDNWKSDIFLTDPGNPAWQNYIFEKQQTVYDALSFDGWHMDQLGDRGDVFKHSGDPLLMKQSYQYFLEAVRERFPDYSFIMNAVNQYGQEEISSAGAPFLYTEVWDPITTYEQLKNILIENKQKWNKNTVLAAYMNYDRADQEGEFNLPGILLTDALIFAHGGAHIELGEHMLSKEYFPHNHLTMTKALKERLVHYYDFMVGYQNLLRGDELSPDELAISSPTVNVSLQPEKGSVYAFSKKTKDKKIVHVLNFTDVEHMNWRDPNGTQKKPEVKKDISMQVDETRQVDKVWMASPDSKKGVPVPVEFDQTDGRLSFTLPHLEYWNMIAIEYKGK